MSFDLFKGNMGVSSHFSQHQSHRDQPPFWTVFCAKEKAVVQLIFKWWVRKQISNNFIVLGGDLCMYIYIHIYIYINIYRIIYIYIYVNIYIYIYAHTHTESAWCIGASYELTCTGNRMINQRMIEGLNPAARMGSYG